MPLVVVLVPFSTQELSSYSFPLLLTLLMPSLTLLAVPLAVPLTVPLMLSMTLLLISAPAQYQRSYFVSGGHRLLEWEIFSGLV